MQKLSAVWKVILPYRSLIDSIGGHFDNGVFVFRIHCDPGLRSEWWWTPLSCQLSKFINSIMVKTKKDIVSIFVKNVSEDNVKEFRASLWVDMIANPVVEDGVKKLINQIAPVSCDGAHAPSEGQQLLLSL